MNTSIEQNLTSAVMPHDAYWLIEPSAGFNLWQHLKTQGMQQHITVYAAAQAAKGQEEKPSKPYQMEGSTAIFSLAGPMTKSPTSMSSGTSTVRMRRQVRQAMTDPDVSSAVMVIDSPGGSVAGTADLGADIAAFAAQKPILAYVEDQCCSAAMWIASQCTQVLANATALVGSIGTVMVLQDSSRLYQNAGIEPLVFGTGKFKGAGAEGTEITAEHRAYFQSLVEGLNQHFIAAIRAGRKVTEEQMAKLLDAGVFVGAAAMDVGLIDGIATREEAMTIARTLSSGGALAHASVPRILPAMGKQQPAVGKQEIPMRNTLAAALASIGLTTMAARVLGANTDDPEALAKIVAESPATQPATTPAAAGAPTPVPAASATVPVVVSVDAAATQYATMQGIILEQQKQMASLQAQFLAKNADAKYNEHVNALTGLVRQMRLMPAQAEGYKAFAKSNPEAFDALWPTLSAAPVLPQLRAGGRISAPAGAGGDAADQLSAIALDMAAKTGKPLSECLLLASDSNPALAREHYASAGVSGEGTN